MDTKFIEFAFAKDRALSCDTPSTKVARSNISILGSSIISSLLLDLRHLPVELRLPHLSVKVVLSLFLQDLLVALPVWSFCVYLGYCAQRVPEFFHVFTSRVFSHLNSSFSISCLSLNVLPIFAYPCQPIKLFLTLSFDISPAAIFCFNL